MCVARASLLAVFRTSKKTRLLQIALRRSWLDSAGSNRQTGCVTVSEKRRSLQMWIPQVITTELRMYRTFEEVAAEAHLQGGS